MSSRSFTVSPSCANALEEIKVSLQKDGIQKVVAGAVIQDGKKTLLVRRTPDEFMPGLVELPSGTIDPGENILEGLVREVLEETGLNANKVIAYLGSFDYTSGSGKKTRQLNFSVSAEKNSPIVLNPSEHDEYYWVNPSDENFSEYNISDSTRSVVVNSYHS